MKNSSGVSGRAEWNKPNQSPEVIKAVKCAKCGKEIPVGQEVKKGFLLKKSYHRGCSG